MTPVQRKLWRSLRYWPPGLCPGYPLLRAEVWIRRKTLECRFLVICQGEVYWSCPCQHPVTWTFKDYEQEQEAVVKYIKTAVRQVDAKRELMSEVGAKWARDYEALHEYLTCEELPGGGSRTTSMLCVFFEAGVCKLALQDRQEGQSLWVSAMSLPEAIEALEARLRAGDGDWRPMRAAQQHKGKKR